MSVSEINDESVRVAEQTLRNKTALCAVDLGAKIIKSMVGNEISLRSDNVEELMASLIISELNL